MSAERTSDLWWKHAVIYALDVETFRDSNGDGHGDLEGLLSRIDYMAGIGVTCLWLLPFYPTPDRDDGYDISDYYGVDDRLGTLGEFVELIRTAKDRGMRVIVDLVINHTSDEHPWFRDALESRDSAHRDFYVWSDEPREDLFEMVIFPDEEDGNWEYHEPTEQYYLHRFYGHQPDLNIANPDVRDSFAEIVGFWLQLGVDGFRVDAVPYLIETEGITEPEEVDSGERHTILRDLHRFMNRRNGSTALLGEVNLPAEEACTYFGDRGDELNLIFGFDVNQAMWLALARQDAGPLAAALDALPEVDDEVHWANFARLHDEANVGRLSEEERQEVFDAFGPSEDMQSFGRGIRRRLATMLGGDGDRIRLVQSLVLTLPGVPVLYYGEEIGMGENLELDGRLAMRTTMQWRPTEDGGFGPPGGSRSHRRPTAAEYGPENVNVAQQQTDDASLLNWMSRAIRIRRQIPEIGGGDWSLLDTDDPALVAHRCQAERSSFVAVHNLTDDRRETVLSVDEEFDVVFGCEGADVGGEDGSYRIALPRYGHVWLQSAGAWP